MDGNKTSKVETGTCSRQAPGAKVVRKTTYLSYSTVAVQNTVRMGWMGPGFQGGFNRRQLVV